MRAWVYEEHGDPDTVLAFRAVAPPVARDGEVLVDVASAAVNFADGLMVRGTYQANAPLPAVPGMEIVGHVVGPTPPGCPLSERDRVVALTRDLSGAYAERAAVHATDAFPAPEALDDAQAAAFLVTYQTAWFALHRRARVHAGEWVLVHAAAGGVGSATVQLARAAGARTIGVVGSDAKTETARALGCEAVIDRSSSDVAERVLDLTSGHGADVVVDPIGGDSFETSTRSIAFEGRLVVVGFASGTPSRPRGEHVMVKNYGVLGLHWGAYRSRYPGAVRRAHEELTALTTAGVVSPLVGHRHPLDRALDALADVATGRSVGRVVLTIDQGATTP